MSHDLPLYQDAPTAGAGKHIVFGSDEEEVEDDGIDEETTSEVTTSKKTLFEDSQSEDETSGDDTETCPVKTKVSDESRMWIPVKASC